jgi:hypothetical protein
MRNEKSRDFWFGLIQIARRIVPAEELGPNDARVKLAG